MAYPDKEMLEQHLVAHKIERRFICDLCGAGLKRKEHLERHKLGHNPERPFVCNVCCKGKYFVFVFFLLNAYTVYTYISCIIM